MEAQSQPRLERPGVAMGGTEYRSRELLSTMRPQLKLIAVSAVPIQCRQQRAADGANAVLSARCTAPVTDHGIGTGACTLHTVLGQTARHERGRLLEVMSW